MSRTPVITGIGLVTPLGASARDTWDALLAGQSIRRHARSVGCGGAPARIFDIAESAAREAVASADWLRRGGDASSVATVLATSKGPVETWLPGMDRASTGGGGGEVAVRSASPVSHRTPVWRPSGFGLSEVAATVADRLGFRGPRLTLSAACASGLHGLIRGVMMIRAGEASRVIVVAAEASVHPLFVGSFQRLGVLAPEGSRCMPFDERRAGFLMSEAAAAVCLESLEEASGADDEHGTRVCIERCAVGGDATHLTAADAEARTLRSLLARVVDGRRIDLLHAHGTGTIQNDPVELSAVDATLAGTDDRRASLYSHKGALGHSLGAAGLVSVVINVLCHRAGLVPPNVNTHHPLPARHVQIDPHAVARPIQRSLAAASGFGGPAAVVSLVSG